ncbi:MAG: hypothetical protein ACK4XJ_02165 [Fimbriimonadaceae bacterium]
MNNYLGTYEDEFTWVDEYDDKIDEMRQDLVQFEEQISLLERKFQATLDPDVHIQLSQARRAYWVTADTIDFLVMHRRHRLEWQRHSLGGKR